MDDKNTMENLLSNAKGACDLYLHGTIEASTPEVNQTFSAALNSCLAMQNRIYHQMEQKGWYSADAAPQQKIEQVKQKFTAQG